MHGLRLDQTQRERTALICAVVGGHTACARLLIDGGADKEAHENVRDMRVIFLLLCCLEFLRNIIFYLRL